MSSVSRTSQFAKVHKILKKHYKPVVPDPGRSVLEHLLFACCLEDAHFEAAEEAYVALVHTFYDWNEVRVTTIAELSEVMSSLPDPRSAANRVKRVLQGLFEASYSFDLEEHRKKNLGPTVKWLEKIDGTSNFAIAYVVQAALGGHSIPVGQGELRVLRIADLITDKDVESQAVPGLERAVAKSKGVEFGSLLHQIGADFTANPYAPNVREILLEINPDCKDRFPKRRVEKKPVKKPEAEAAPEGVAPAPTAEKKKSEGTQQPGAAKKSEEHPAPSASEKRKKSEEHPTPAAAAEKASSSSGPPKKKSVAEGISKRKPR